MLYGPLNCPDSRTVSVSPQSATVLVRGTPEELRQVANYLDNSNKVVGRQVLIEARILEVALNDGYESGINWAAFLRSGQVGASLLSPGAALGTTNTGALLQGNGITAGVAGAAQQAMAAGGRSIAAQSAAPGSIFSLVVQSSNFAALMNFLQTQGVVHTLSSPRVAAMNNQKAVIKVGADSLFITRVSGGSVTQSAVGGVPTVTSPTFDVQSFFSGIAMDVTPQIAEDGKILLHVRPSISDVSQRSQNVDLGNLGNYVLPLVSNNVSETDSMIRVNDGQIVALGGLMRTVQTDRRSGVTGLASLPVVGSLFRNTTLGYEKRELVILLKTTLIEGDGGWARDIGEAAGRFKALDRGVFVDPAARAQQGKPDAAQAR